MKALILGCGSIGAHLANAVYQCDGSCDIFDPSSVARLRFVESLYPGRYGVVPKSLQILGDLADAKDSYDLVIIGTPPDKRCEALRQVAHISSKITLLEKPLCDPSSFQALAFELEVRRSRCDTRVVSGYNHVCSENFSNVLLTLNSGCLGEIVHFEINWRESWEGILDAHPWLGSVNDSYLGNSVSGGGASGEHSHGLHLGVVLLHYLGAWGTCSADTYEKRIPVFSEACDAEFRVELNAGKITGTVFQDVFTAPARKRVEIYGTHGHLTWEIVSAESEFFQVRSRTESTSNILEKRRSDDFFMEIKEIESLLSAPRRDSWLDVCYAYDVMEILNKHHGE